MGVIIRNGIEYSGAGMGGGSCDCDEIVYLTQEEYDALPETKESNNVEYRITNANTHVNAARDWAYDNSESGLEAETVQDAIDEVNSGLGTLNESLIYSTEETICGKWIDGKPLYRKMIDFGTLPNNTNKIVPHNISNVDHIHVNLGASYWYSYENLEWTYSFAFNNYIKNIYAGKTDVIINTIVDATKFRACVFVEYTKITD